MPSKPPIVFPQEQRLLTAFGERLRLARLRRKLPATTVAQRAGISPAAVHKIEKSGMTPTIASLMKIAAALGISPRTVDRHRSNMAEKLGLNGMHALTKFAVRHISAL